MYCPKCGKLNEDGNKNCISCNAELPSKESQELLNKLKNGFNLEEENNKDEVENAAVAAGESVTYSEEKTAKKEEMPKNNSGFVPPPSYTRGEIHNPYAEKKLRSYLIPSILVTLICSLGFPFGICAIVFAAECERFIAEGQLELAKRFSNKALVFMILNIVLAVLIGLVIVSISVIGINFYNSQRSMFPFNMYDRFYYGY
ncbi:MAG: hypothetical protein GX196_02725 [Clostridiaceae bacterium]|nr:hypothetical protein [Clostridiaceae bacterium]